MVFRKLFGLATRVGAAKEIPELTKFLSNNETFKKFAIQSHKTASGARKDLEAWLDKEILEPEQRKEIDEKTKQESQRKK